MEKPLQRKRAKRRSLNWRDKQLADKIRWYRRDRNFTQEKLSELLRMNLTYVSSVERYKRGVSFPILYKLSRIFKIKVKDLFDF
ncbi:MAG: helix-turn-helix transcriptional regulator [Patescibacteria group bacterium]